MHRSRISRHGNPNHQSRVNKYDTDRDRLLFYGWLITDSGCWEYRGVKDSAGYGVVRRSNGKPDKAHRVSYRELVGEITEGGVICHKCDNPPCVNPEHLWLGTMMENTHDMLAKGRMEYKTGYDARVASITRETVDLVRADWEAEERKRGLPGRLAQKYGIGRNTVRRIVGVSNEGRTY